jgi:hypothetical protein
MLLVATIPPQRPPRCGWAQATAYNASLPAVIARLRSAGMRVGLVDIQAALGAGDLMADGVHPNRVGMDKMADAWYEGFMTSGLMGECQPAPGGARA